MNDKDAQGVSQAMPPVSALAKITAFLRHFDDELALLKAESSGGRLMSIPAEGSVVNAVLGGLEIDLAAVVQALHLEAEHVDPRQRARGPLHILWADLVDMSPERLRKQYGLGHIPESWPQLHERLVLAVERAIRELADQGSSPPAP